MQRDLKRLQLQVVSEYEGTTWKSFSLIGKKAGPT